MMTGRQFLSGKRRTERMTKLADKLRNRVSALKVQENLYRWKPTTVFLSNIGNFTSEAIPIASIKKGTFSLTGICSYDSYNSDSIQLTFLVKIDDDDHYFEILQIAKECMLQISVTVYDKNNVEKFNHIKKIRWTDLLETKSVEVLPSTSLLWNNEQEYQGNIILEAKVEQIYDDLGVSQESVLKDIKSMYKTKEFADFKIRVQNREFLAHKFILCRSEVFQEMFRSNMEETKKNEAEFKDVASGDFEELLLFMYTNKISSREKATLELADAAERFGMIELRCFCEDYVEKKIHLDNAVPIFAYADLRDRDSLKKTAVDFIIKNKDKFKDADLQPVFENPNFCKMVVRNNCE